MCLAAAGCAQQRVRPVGPSVDPSGGRAAAKPPVSETLVVGAGDSGLQPAAEAADGASSEGGVAAEQAAEAPVVPPEPIVERERILVLPSVPFVDRRMMDYADKLASWESLAAKAAGLGLRDRMPSRWYECLATVGEMLHSYSVLMEALLAQDQPAVGAAQFAVDPWQVYQDDITFLAGGCDQAFGAGEALVGKGDRQAEAEVKDSETSVARYVEEARYEDAVAAYQALLDSQPARISANTSKMYGLALLRTGNFDRATEVLADALERMRSSPDERTLRRLVADLLLASGSLAEARGHYRRLADYFASRMGDDRWVADQLALLDGVDMEAREFPLYREVLKGYVSFDGRHMPTGLRELVAKMENDAPESPLTDQARRMLRQLRDSIGEWVAGRMDAIDVLVANNAYGPAKSLLERMLFDDFPAAVHDKIQRAMDNLLAAETRYREEQRLILEESLSAQWDKAVQLLDSQEYDQAIAVFRKLFHTEYDVPARANIQKAAEAASVEMRRKSANLFVQSRKEEDPDRKRELLRESWQLIHDITIKYPGVRLMDKVRQNLAIIEKHIEVFDPAMLRELQGASRPEPGESP
jgi:tetratricopeptide (TPR) repeat protein